MNYFGYDDDAGLVAAAAAADVVVVVEAAAAVDDDDVVVVEVAAVEVVAVEVVAAEVAVVEAVAAADTKVLDPFPVDLCVVADSFEGLAIAAVASGNEDPFGYAFVATPTASVVPAAFYIKPPAVAE